MYIKSGALLIVALIPLTSVAAKGDFDFSISGKNTSFDSGCIAVSYTHLTLPTKA